MTLKLYVESQTDLPDDEELMRITKYVSGSMTEAQADTFEEQLADDEEFFERVSPLLDAWYAPGLTPTEIETAKRMQAEGRLPGSRRRPRYEVYLAMALAASITIVMIQQLRTDAGTPAKPGAPGRINMAQNPLPATKPTTPARVVIAPRPSRAPAPIVVAESEAERALAASALEKPIAAPSATVVTAPDVVVPDAVLPPSSLSEDSTYVVVAQQLQNLIKGANTAPDVSKPSVWARVKRGVGTVLGALDPRRIPLPKTPKPPQSRVR